MFPWYSSVIISAEWYIFAFKALLKKTKNPKNPL